MFHHPEWHAHVWTFRSSFVQKARHAKTDVCTIVDADDIFLLLIQEDKRKEETESPGGRGRS